ncbi:hypothetical protein AB0F15_34570 [Amycolatopsis sp. NPDC026612]|uniref:hypothetical protein n=1 Tax=Amycolatopsis sp. NPDC026612 TaxID=3155466 RepID=UPI0033D5CE0F
MDRPSQDPPEPLGSPPEAADSPLSFPVEASRPAGPEPGSGAPQESPAEASRPGDVAGGAGFAPVHPGEVPPQGEPLRFPAEAPRPQDAFTGPPSAPLQPAPLPYPVAQIPGAATAAPPPVAEPPEAPAPAPPVPLLRFVPPVLAVIAAVMTALGSFLPLFRIRQQIGSGQQFLDNPMIVTETAWGSSFEIPGQEVTDQTGSPVGIPLLIAVVLLVAAALTLFPRTSHRLGRRLIAAGAAFTAGVVITVAMSGIGWSALAGGGELEVATAPGMWLLIAGTVAAAAAAAVAYLPARGRFAGDWADPAVAYADTPTPPAGVAITVLPPEPGEDQRG